MKYRVVVAGRAFEITVDGDRVLVNGEPRAAVLTPIPHTPLQQLALQGRSRTLAIGPEDGGWLVQLGGRALLAEVEDERTRQLREMTGQDAGRAAGGVVRAPMPGLVLRVEVEDGQTVEPGSGVVVLEAMKMENEIKAGVGGVVRAIRVVAGDTVEKGTVLLELSSQP